MRCTLIAILLFLFASPLTACDVPVYRYALEQWRPDAYDICVVYVEPLKPEDRALVDALEALENQANVSVTLLDPHSSLSRKIDPPVPLPPGTKLPWLVVRSPAGERTDRDVWAGSLQAAAVKGLQNSPVRRAIAKRILAGETAVFLLLESGRKDRDEAAARSLQNDLLSLNEPVKRPGRQTVEKAAPPPSAYSMIRVSRNDPCEQVLVQMLLQRDIDLADQTEPVVFPVFGRGRVLPPLIGAEITRENLERIGQILTAPCSCNVKRQFPGIDLLMSVDWDGILAAQSELASPAPSDPGTGMGALEYTANSHAEAGTADKMASEGRPRAWLLAALGLSALLTLLTGIRAGRFRRRRSNHQFPV
jgi:hypothetical protein